MKNKSTTQGKLLKAAMTLCLLLVSTAVHAAESQSYKMLEDNQGISSGPLVSNTYMLQGGLVSWQTINANSNAYAVTQAPADDEEVPTVTGTANFYVPPAAVYRPSAPAPAAVPSAAPTFAPVVPVAPLPVLFPVRTVVPTVVTPAPVLTVPKATVPATTTTTKATTTPAGTTTTSKTIPPAKAVTAPAVAPAPAPVVAPAFKPAVGTPTIILPSTTTSPAKATQQVAPAPARAPVPQAMPSRQPLLPAAPAKPATLSQPKLPSRGVAPPIGDRPPSWFAPPSNPARAAAPSALPPAAKNPSPPVPFGRAILQRMNARAASRQLVSVLGGSLLSVASDFGRPTDYLLLALCGILGIALYRSRKSLRLFRQGVVVAPRRTRSSVFHGRTHPFRSRRV